jgi:hypothetical protein
MTGLQVTAGALSAASLSARDDAASAKRRLAQEAETALCLLCNRPGQISFDERAGSVEATRMYMCQDHL